MKHQRRKKGSERRVLVFHPLWKVAAVHYANLKHQQDDHGNHAHDPRKETLQNVDEEQVCGVPGFEMISLARHFLGVFQVTYTAPRL